MWKKSDARDREFSAFVAARQRALLRCAYAMCGDAETAQDVVQTVLVRMYVRWDKIANDDPAAYANKAISRELIDLWRKRNRHQEVPLLVESHDSHDDPIGAVIHSVDLGSALMTLTQNERIVLVMRYLAGSSEAEIATAIGAPVGTVKSTSSRARRKLEGLLTSADTTHARREG